MAPPVETPYGQSVNPEDAPAAISQAVASLPPEQMYSLMKDMKEVIMVRIKGTAFCSNVFRNHKNFLNRKLFRIIQWKLEICYYKILNLHMLYYKHKW